MIAWVPYAVLGATALLAVALSVVQTHIDRSGFARYLGAANPVAVMIVVSALAFGSLSYLRSHGSFEIVSREGVLAGLRFTAVVVSLLAVAAIGADLLLRYPRGMNVRAPDAFFFYPAIGFLVEVCLHAVQLALLVALFARSGIPFRSHVLAPGDTGSDARGRLPDGDSHHGGDCGVLGSSAALLRTSAALRLPPLWLRGMYVFRLAYYALWHIACGAIRLHWLF